MITLQPVFQAYKFLHITTHIRTQACAAMHTHKLSRDGITQNLKVIKVSIKISQYNDKLQYFK